MRRLRAPQIIQIASLLVIQAFLWGGFLTRTKRSPAGPVLITYGALAIAAGIISLIVWSRRRRSLLRLSVVLAYTFLLLIVDFSFFYWSYGSTANFNISLTHLDAIYVALGTLSTAGTGNISAVSETARGLQSLQMALDLGLVLLALGMAITRLSIIPEKPATAPVSRELSSPAGPSRYQPGTSRACEAVSPGASSLASRAG